MIIELWLNWMANLTKEWILEHSMVDAGWVMMYEKVLQFCPKYISTYNSTQSFPNKLLNNWKYNLSLITGDKFLLQTNWREKQNTIWLTYCISTRNILPKHIGKRIGKEFHKSITLCQKRGNVYTWYCTDANVTGQAFFTLCKYV